MLTKEEKAMSPQRRKIKGHYFDGASTGFLVGTIGGLLLFRGFGYWPALIAVLFYFSLNYLEKISYKQIKDAFESQSKTEKMAK